MRLPPKTGQSQVADNGLAAVRRGDDVVNLESEFVIALGHVTVFARLVRSPPDQCFERPFHLSRFVQETRRRDLSN